MKQGRDRIKILLVALWVTFTVTLAAWWMIFGLRQLDRLNQLHVEQADQLQKHYQMLLWEGGILIASLIGGGLAEVAHAETFAQIQARGILRWGGDKTGGAPYIYERDGKLKGFEVELADYLAAAPDPLQFFLAYLGAVHARQPTGSVMAIPAGPETARA